MNRIIWKDRKCRKADRIIKRYAKEKKEIDEQKL